MEDLFVTGPNKDIIRKEFDAPIISSDYHRRQQLLTYFGLCGQDMLDVAEWLPYLGQVVAVDWDPDVVSMIYHTAASLGILEKVTAYTANVNDFLIDKEDDLGQPLPDSTFDVVNLDYYSPPLIKDLTGEARPLQAIRELFEHQSVLHASFRLFITSTVRVRDQGELDKVFDDIARELAKLGINADQTIEWYANRTVEWKMKVWLPRTLDTIATAFRFALRDHKAFRYAGTGGSCMVHFALGFEYDPERTTAKSLSPLDLLSEPLYCVRGKHVSKVQEEPP